MIHSVTPWDEGPAPAIENCSFGVVIVGPSGMRELIGAGFVGPYEIWFHICVSVTLHARLGIVDPQQTLAQHSKTGLMVKRYVGAEDSERTVSIGELHGGRLSITPGMILPTDERLLLTA